MLVGSAATRWAWVVVLAAWSGAATAGCIADAKKADVAARIVATTRVCPGYKSATDADAVEVMLGTGAIRRMADVDEACDALVIAEVAEAWGRMIGMSARERDIACRGSAELFGRTPVGEYLRLLGLMK